jgi:hypothetical protein
MPAFAPVHSTAKPLMDMPAARAGDRAWAGAKRRRVAAAPLAEVMRDKRAQAIARVRTVEILAKRG